MANYPLQGSKTYQIVFFGGAWLNVTTSSGFSEADAIAPDEIAATKTGRYFYRSMTETLSALGVMVSESNICYIRDITGQTSLKPNPIQITSTVPAYQLDWSALGQFQVTTDVDGIIYVPQAGTITGVFLTRFGAGSSGNTTVDIHKNGTTLYTTQGNRPSIAFNDSDKVVSATLPDVVSLAEGDRLTFDIDAIEAGAPTDLRCTLRIRPTI